MLTYSLFKSDTSAIQLFIIKLFQCILHIITFGEFNNTIKRLCKTIVWQNEINIQYKLPFTLAILENVSKSDTTSLTHEILEILCDVKSEAERELDLVSQFNNNRRFQKGIRGGERDRRPTDESLHSIFFIYETIEHSRDSSKDEVHRKFVGVNRVDDKQNQLHKRPKPGGLYWTHLHCFFLV